MAGIKIAPRAAVPRKKLTLTLRAPLIEQIERYAAYLGGASDRSYVVEQVLEQFLAQDRDFQRWLAEQRDGSEPLRSGR